MRDGRAGDVRRRLIFVRRLTAALLGATAVAATLAPSGAEGASALPRIRHVWVVMLENQGVGAWSSDPGLSALRSHGAMISKYFGIAHQSLPNYVAIIGGQSPTPETQADCQTYRDLSPGDRTADYQANGDGCVYPARYITLADQLAALGLRWKGYMEDLNFDPADAPVTCNPAAAQGNAGTADPTQRGRSNDQYALRHDPFMYFHSIIDHPGQCANVVTLQSDANGLRHDLLDMATTPNFSFVVPNLCNDGHDNGQPLPCAGPDAMNKSNSGLAAVDDWVSIYLPMILASPAYQQDGMVVMAFDEATSSDGAACCNQRQYPNTPAGGPPTTDQNGGGGGGQVGAVILSPFIKPGTTTPNSYNHYSLLRTLEDIFHTVGGDDHNGHLGYASDNTAAITMNPGEFGADVFTNPGYVPPPPPSPGTFNLPPVLQPYAPSPFAPKALRDAITTAVTPAASPAPSTSPTAGEPSPTPVHWDRGMLASLPGESGGAGAIAALVLAPLLVTGAVTLFLRRRGGSG